MNETIIEFEEDKKYIDEYPLESKTGTKKMMKTYHINAVNSRNAYINNKIEKYNKLKESVYSEIERRTLSLIPKDSSNNYTSINDKINAYKDIIKYNNNYNTICEKTGLDQIITDIGDIGATDLIKVNNLIGKVLEIFNKASIILTIDDFDYTMYVNNYMNTYFNSYNSDTFEEDMKKIFDELYWECPSLITHIKLSIINIYHKYQKQLESAFNDINKSLLEKNNTTKETYLDEFEELNRHLDMYKDKDTYLLSYDFLYGTSSIYDYFDDSPQYRKNFNKFMMEGEFSSLDSKEMNDLLLEIKNLKNVIIELNGYNKYKVLIDDIIDRYNKKDSLKGIYQSKLKEVEKEEKERSNLYNSYKKNKTGFLFFSKKTDKELLKVKINDQIKKLDELYKELNDARINEVIIDNINDTSTIHDALSIGSSFYFYFRNMYKDDSSKEIDYNLAYQEMFEYINSPYNNFIKKMKLLDPSDIIDIIFDKYRLLKMNVTKEDLTENIDKLEDSVDYINLLNNINNSSISIENIKYIMEFKKLEG